MRKRKMHGTHIVAALAMLLGLCAPGVANDSGIPNVDERLAGQDRYETAVSVSRAGFPNKTAKVFLASGEHFPDALSATTAAAASGGTLLLSKGSEIPQAVKTELTRLAPEEIFLIGGPNTLATSVEQEAAAFAKVTRIGGKDRYDTSMQLTLRFFPEDSSTVYFATGENFPDALTAGAAAGAFSLPLVLVRGSDPTLDEATRSLIDHLDIKKAYAIGGNRAIGDRMFSDIRSLIPSVSRLAGENRYETAAAIAKTWGHADKALIASGDTYPDALVGSVLAAKENTPLLITEPLCFTPEVSRTMIDLGVEGLTILGRPESLPDDVAQGVGCYMPHG